MHVFQVVPKLRIELNIPAFSKALVDQQDDADVAFASDDASGSLKNVVQARQLIGILKAVEIFVIKVFSELIRFVAFLQNFLRKLAFVLQTWSFPE